MERKSFFVLNYKDPQEEKSITLKALNISDSDLGLSFIKVSDFVFNTENLSVINPEEEKLRKRLESTKSLHLNIYSILSIEEIGLDHEGLRFQKDKSNLVVFPNSPT
ncbi:MAG: DUF1820 family protein [Bdellovibrionales bacterium]|nr:DUF1820 family protein [Bdellovibrionales bacterium]